MGLQGLSRGHFYFEISTWAAAALSLHVLSSWWAKTVSSFVPEPYLDEVFHIRQAQAYCAGHFHQWDPKITTPPGLYLISWLLHRLGSSCNIESLRQTNVTLLSVLVFNASLHLLLHFPRDARSGTKDAGPASKSRLTRKFVRKLHTSLNICLFPPLFFFSGLYYTDVGSTAFVLVGAWLQHHPRIATFPMLRGILLVVNGTVALFFRQTNVFWIGVFPAALDLVDALDQAPGSLNEANAGLSAQHRLRQTIQNSWSSGVAYDPPYEVTTFEDYFSVALSIGIVAAKKIATVFQVLFPYLVLIVGFAGFVKWNGSVVLGDKSNHVATLHLPQMLYIWPFVVFFSFPLVLPRALALIIPSQHLPSFLEPYRSYNKYGHRILRQALGFIVSTALALLIIHKNTIVHPFTLADNRHYVFYVFRILLRYPSIKYLVSPIYIICGWAVLQTFCTNSNSPPASPKPSHPKSTVTKSTQSNNDEQQIRTSYVLIWLATTAMTLVTAPLVEPRYFILPWIFWRLAVPGPAVQPISKVSSQADGKRDPPSPPNPVMTRLRYLAQVLNHGDQRLYLETVWFLLVNAATGYIFLYWGFAWPQEQGKVQRFMW